MSSSTEQKGEGTLTLGPEENMLSRSLIFHISLLFFPQLQSFCLCICFCFYLSGHK
jgi:hypothetical protein